MEDPTHILHVLSEHILLPTKQANKYSSDTGQSKTANRPKKELELIYYHVPISKNILDIAACVPDPDPEVLSLPDKQRKKFP